MKVKKISLLYLIVCIIACTALHTQASNTTDYNNLRYAVEHFNDELAEQVLARYESDRATQKKLVTTKNRDKETLLTILGKAYVDGIVGEQPKSRQRQERNASTEKIIDLLLKNGADVNDLKMFTQGKNRPTSFYNEFLEQQYKKRLKK